MDKIRKLTIHQINWLYFHPRDDKGELEPVWLEEPVQKSEKELRIAGWMKFGLSRKEAETKWADHRAEQEFRQTLETICTTEPNPYAAYWSRLVAWRLERMKAKQGLMRPV